MEKLITQIGVRRGSDHNTYCEDFAVEHQTEYFHFGVVLDGCSGGKESHFASALFGKLFRQSFDFDFEDSRSVSVVAQVIMCDFYERLYKIAEEMSLQTNELQSTIILSVYNKKRNDLAIIYFGDGVYTVNGDVFVLENTQYENPNAPSYLVNNTLDKGMTPLSFSSWIEEYPNLISWEWIQCFSLFTDGLMSFRHLNGSKANWDKILDFLSFDDWNLENPEVFSRKINLLQNGRGQKNGSPFERDEKVVNADDISMIRVEWVTVNTEENESNTNSNSQQAVESEH